MAKELGTPDWVVIPTESSPGYSPTDMSRWSNEEIEKFALENGLIIVKPDRTPSWVLKIRREDTLVYISGDEGSDLEKTG